MINLVSYLNSYYGNNINNGEWKEMFRINGFIFELFSQLITVIRIPEYLNSSIRIAFTFCGTICTRMTLEVLFCSPYLFRWRVRVIGSRWQRIASEQIREAIGWHTGRGRIGCPSDKNARPGSEEISNALWWSFGLDSAGENEDDCPFEG